MRVAVAHAAEVVKRYRRELCDRIVGPLADRFGALAMQRVADFVEIQIGDAIYSPADDRQRPSAYPFPDLPQTPYLDKSRIAGIGALEAQTPAILSELRSVLSRALGQENVFASKALADKYLHGKRGPAVWDGFYFYRHGARNVPNAAACPLTMAAIDQLPLSSVPGHGPEVLFSILGPGTHLLPHHGVTNVRVVGHLPLIVPADCALSVAGIEHRWRVGEVVTFDDTYSHEAWNHSDEVRVVMIFDMWHPDLTEVERMAMKDLQVALAGFSSRATQLDGS
jgi:aspartate beta-hydroxylase